VPNINGLTFHVLEAGFESKGGLASFSSMVEIAYGWRKLITRLRWSDATPAVTSEQIAGFLQDASAVNRKL